MKKYIISLITSFVVLVASAQAQTVAVTGGFEGTYVFRGVAGEANVGNTSLKLELPSKTTFEVFSTWAVDGLKTSVSEVDLSLSQAYAVDAATTLTVGGTGYFYPKASAAKGQTNYSLEAFASLGYKAFLNPTVTAGYDFNLEQLFAEGSIGQPINLPLLAAGWSLRPSAALGWVAAKDALPEKRGFAVKDSYYYLTGKVDLVYETKNAVVGIGYRHNYLDNSKVKNNSWTGAFLTVRF